MTLIYSQYLAPFLKIQNLKGTISLSLIEVSSKDYDAADEGVGAGGLDNEWIFSIIANVACCQLYPD